MATPSGTTPAPEAPRITQGGKELIPHAVPVLTGAFRDDPIFNYFMGALSEEERRAFLPVFLAGLLKAGTLNKGILLEASSWGCCAVMMPPGRRVDNPRTVLQGGLVGITLQLKPLGIKRVLVEHANAVKRAKRKAFTRRELAEYWYLFIIGTDPGRQRQGLAGALLEHMKAHARGHGRPLWLEASNPNAKGVYAKHGFEEVEEMTLGVGLVGPDGLAKKGGEGVKTWGMVWRPETKK
ncbi:putative acyl- N-acyltransferase [Rosellinia necatrix]|uniref:Putative acyl-N-acyltransferase n=1 Tax=Rosellinia necatrix TaxID=77044 RepID=A0A1W2TSV0_ROSNE|nr:putative acyl- N-acyltransferase [Rosellinia necatrix]